MCDTGNALLQRLKQYAFKLKSNCRWLKKTRKYKLGYIEQVRTMIFFKCGGSGCGGGRVGGANFRYFAEGCVFKENRFGGWGRVQNQGM